MVKGKEITSCVDKRDECNDPLMKHRNRNETLKTGIFTLSRETHGGYLLTGHAGVRCIGGMTLICFVRNLRTGSVMRRGKHKWKTHESRSTDASIRGALLVRADETG